MSPSERFFLHVHIPGAGSYEIGDEIWQSPLDEAIEAEARTIADYASVDVLKDHSEASRIHLRDRVIADMTRVLRRAGDSYRAPDGTRYSLTRSPAA